MPASQTTAPVASAASAAAGPPNRVKRPNRATTTRPELPIDDAVSTSSWMVVERNAIAKATSPSKTTQARAARTRPASESPGRSGATTLWEMMEPPDSRTESTVDRMAEITAPANTT